MSRYEKRQKRTEEVGKAWCEQVRVEFFRTVLDDGFLFWSENDHSGFAKVTKDGKVFIVA